MNDLRPEQSIIQNNGPILPPIISYIPSVLPFNYFVYCIIVIVFLVVFGKDVSSKISCLFSILASTRAFVGPSGELHV